MTDTARIRYTFDIVLAVEMPPAAILATGQEPIIEPNGRSYCPLADRRASAVVDADVSDEDAARKAVATAAYWFKQECPEWAETKLHGLGVELHKRALVR